MPFRLKYPSIHWQLKLNRSMIVSTPRYSIRNWESRHDTTKLLSPTLWRSRSLISVGKCLDEFTHHCDTTAQWSQRKSNKQHVWLMQRNLTFPGSMVRQGRDLSCGIVLSCTLNSSAADLLPFSPEPSTQKCVLEATDRKRGHLQGIQRSPSLPIHHWL